MLLDSLDQQLRITEEECRGYKEFLEQLETTDSDEKEEDYDQTLKQVSINYDDSYETHILWYQESNSQMACAVYMSS